MLTLFAPLVVTGFLIYNYVQCPFPLSPPLVNQQSSLILPGNSTLRVSSEQFNYVSNLKKLATLNGFQEGNYILDMTGQSPGLIYALGGKPLGWPWILDLLPGSDNAALQILSKVAKTQLDNSYVLISDETKHLHPFATLRKIGLDVNDPNSFQLVAEANPSFLIGKVYLYKPINNESVQDH